MNKKHLALLPVGAACCALGITAVRAAAVKAKPNTATPKISATPDEEKKYAQTLSAMVQVPTISLRGNNDLTQFEKLHEVMREKFPNVFEKMEYTELEGNILLRLPGKDPTRNGILLMGHQDVVTAEEKTWEHDPFSGEIDENAGLIHGRGTMDCKCTVMAEFQAMDELIAQGFEPECDVYLSSSVNEEISGGGAEIIVEHLKAKGVRLDAVMDEGGALMKGALPGMSCWCAAIGVLEKGYMDVKIKAKGNGGHSSTPPKNTPLVRLAAFITDMEKAHPYKCEITPLVESMLTQAAPILSYPIRYVLANFRLFKPALLAVLPKVSPYGEAFLSTTFAFTMCNGAKTPNVIPDEAYVICNLRPSQQQNAEASLAVLKKFADKHDLELEVIYKRDASNCVNLEGDEYAYLKQCINDCYPDAGVIPYLMTGGTDCRHYEALSDSCMRFCPIRMNTQQLAAMHAANENIGIAELAQSVKFYKYYIENHK